MSNVLDLLQHHLQICLCCIPRSILIWMEMARRGLQYPANTGLRAQCSSRWSLVRGHCAGHQWWWGIENPVNNVQFSRDSFFIASEYPQLLCSGSRDNSVCLWDLDVGKPVSSMYAPRNVVTDLKWLLEEKAVVQASEDKTLRVWDLISCSTVQHFRARNHLQVIGA